MREGVTATVHITITGQKCCNRIDTEPPSSLPEPLATRERRRTAPPPPTTKTAQLLGSCRPTMYTESSRCSHHAAPHASH